MLYLTMQSNDDVSLSFFSCGGCRNIYLAALHMLHVTKAISEVAETAECAED